MELQVSVGRSSHISVHILHSAFKLKLLVFHHIRTKLVHRVAMIANDVGKVFGRPLSHVSVCVVESQTILLALDPT